MEAHQSAEGGRWFRPPLVGAVAAAWGAAEASLFFIVPDVWLGLVVLRAPRHIWATVVGITAGAIGGAAALRISIRAGLDIDPLMARLPGLSARDLARARAELIAQGPVAFLNGPFQGLPVKVYVDEATQLGVPLPRILLMTALNRLERIVPLTLLALLGGRVSRGFVRRHPTVATAGYVGAWAAFYAWYFRSRSRRPEDPL